MVSLNSNGCSDFDDNALSLFNAGHFSGVMEFLSHIDIVPNFFFVAVQCTHNSYFPLLSFKCLN